MNILLKETRIIQNDIDRSWKLKMYNRTLFLYQLSRKLPWLKGFLCTDYGFCYFFKCYYSVYYLDNLKELVKYAPNSYCAFWFPSGELEPRIEILKKVIIDLKENKI